MNISEVTIIDYGSSNLLSVQRGFEYCGAKVAITADHKKIISSSRVVLPGVGAFADAMKALSDLDLIDVISEVAHRNIPFLGICLGMQLLLDESEEFGLTAGLGLIPGRVIPIPSMSPSGRNHKVPHIGWNTLKQTKPTGWETKILDDISEGESVYFNHSFMALPLNQDHCIAQSMYGDQKIAAVIKVKNILGCQFHPEKSGQVGLKILKKFSSNTLL
jgi:imidazole glycerol-phosphate synthase subunit HisH